MIRGAAISLIAAAAAWLLVIIGRAVIQIVQLSVGGTAFLAVSKAAKGDAVTIGILPPRLLFLHDPVAVRRFFTADVENIDFRAAVEHFTQRIFQVRLTAS